MRSWKLVGAWVVVLLVTTSVAWQIVSLASNQVSDEPVAIVPATTNAPERSTSTSSDISPTTSSTRSTAGSSPTTSTPGGGGTSSSSSSSTSATSAAEWSLRTITTPGGTVVVRYRPDEVELQAATPAPGFEVDIDDPGPPRVRVEFEEDDTDIRVEARWEEGTLDIEVTGDS